MTLHDVYVSQVTIPPLGQQGERQWPHRTGNRGEPASVSQSPRWWLEVVRLGEKGPLLHQGLHHQKHRIGQSEEYQRLDLGFKGLQQIQTLFFCSFVKQLFLYQ